MTFYQLRLELPDNVRKRYVKNLMNYGKYSPSDIIPYTPLGLLWAFQWDKTPEGKDFWGDLNMMLCSGRLSSESKIKIPDHE